MIIYRATNLLNGKMYIGQTIKSLKIRINAHIQFKGNTYFKKAINKYGIENFKWDVLCECKDIDELNKMEEFCITFWDTFRNGYNETTGGLNKARNKASKETRKKMSESRTGFKHTDETKKKISESKIGIIFSDEHIKNLSESHKGIEHTEESKRKLSESLKNSEKYKLSIPERNKKISDSRKGMKFSDEHKKHLHENHTVMIGKTNSDETKKKISDSNKLYWLNKNK